MRIARQFAALLLSARIGNGIWVMMRNAAIVGSLTTISYLSALRLLKNNST
jgi:hypothetical protein